MSTPNILSKITHLHFKAFNLSLVVCFVKGLFDGYYIGNNNHSTANTSQTTTTILESTTEDETKKPLPSATKELLKRDPIAWPTLLLLIISLSGWSSAWYLRLRKNVSPIITIPISVISTYWSFTVLHDAVHGAISNKYKWLNPFIGTIGGIPLMAPYQLFKVIHLSHHRYSGDHDSAIDQSSLDPDEWAGRLPSLLLPLRWATVLHYYVWWFTKFMTARAFNPNTPQQVLDADSKVRKYTIIQMFITLVILRKLANWDSRTLSICWLLPHTISSAFLMYFFDYIPHRPHVIPYRIDPYKSTNATKFWSWGKVDELWWTFICLSQNMHIVHHIWPSVPFYRYIWLWRAHEQELIEKGVRVVPLYINKSMEEEFDELKKN
jgi:beta-carotene hydroxylase